MKEKSFSFGWREMGKQKTENLVRTLAFTWNEMRGHWTAWCDLWLDLSKGILAVDMFQDYISR